MSEITELQSRRAVNTIWNGAHDYGFQPDFKAYDADGNAELYWNLLLGALRRHYEYPKLRRLFDAFAKEEDSEVYEGLLWLGLENCVYEKELPERPILTQLRKERAERFYQEQQTLSRQQMEFQSMPVYNQQEYRWATVSGRRPPLLSPREKRIAEALLFSGELDTDGVINAMRDFLNRFFRYTPGETEEKRPRPTAFWRLLLRRETKRRDRLLVRIGTGEGNHPKAKQQRHEGLGRHVGPTEEDAAYIRAVFGRSILSEQENRILENELCVGVDEDCRLWVTRGEPCETDDRDALEVRESAERQRARNEAYQGEHAAMVQSAVRALSTRIETIFSSYFKHLPEPARAGRICPEKAYRLPILDDGRVFLKDGEETEPEICVDLLLDASQSRMHSQEVLSAEAAIIAKSLAKVHIPVRVTAFRSIRGYTVLEILKGWTQSDCRGLYRYYAGGWNRDSLAIETLGRLDDDAVMRGKQRIILVLTDASPHDSTPIAAAGLNLPREYEGAAGVQAAQTAVRALRSRGVRVGAVFHGSTTHLENVHTIYGHAYVRIRKASQLAQGVSDLLLMLMREMRTD